MRHNIASELTEAMDSLYFSSDTKEDMVKMLMKQQKARYAKPVPAKGRKLLLVAVVSATVLATLTGAAVFTRWSKTAQAAYNPPQQVKEQAEKTGLSVMLENKTEETNPGEVLSATDQGITITAVQSIVDNYGAKLFFRVEGFTLPENYRVSLYLHYYEQYSAKEIAQVMGKKEATVTQYLSRGRRKLRDRLSDERRSQAI